MLHPTVAYLVMLHPTDPTTPYCDTVPYRLYPTVPYGTVVLYRILLHPAVSQCIILYPTAHTVTYRTTAYPIVHIVMSTAVGALLYTTHPTVPYNAVHIEGHVRYPTKLYY